jgi:hypothetical protein
VNAAVSWRQLRSLENIAAQVGGFVVENRVMGGFEFGVSRSVGEETE